VVYKNESKSKSKSTNKSTNTRTTTNVNVVPAGVIKLYFKNIRITKGSTLLGDIQRLMETCCVTNVLRRNTNS
jgi:hypothetical protein